MTVGLPAIKSQSSLTAGSMSHSRSEGGLLGVTSHGGSQGGGLEASPSMLSSFSSAAGLAAFGGKSGHHSDPLHRLERAEAKGQGSSLKKTEAIGALAKLSRALVSQVNDLGAQLNDAVAASEAKDDRMQEMTDQCGTMQDRLRKFQKFKAVGELVDEGQYRRQIDQLKHELAANDVVLNPATNRSIMAVQVNTFGAGMGVEDRFLEMANLKMSLQDELVYSLKKRFEVRRVEE
jgi:hypothetical protein